MMDSDVDTRIESLGVILVASTNMNFAEAVGHMVAEIGYTAAFPAGLEAPWLSVTRTQPRVVICDYDAPVRRIRRLIAEVSTRRVPLLIAHTAEPRANKSLFSLLKRVTWLTFPASTAAVQRALSDLVLPDSDRGIPHQDEPNEAEKQYRMEQAQLVDPSAGHIESPAEDAPGAHARRRSPQRVSGRRSHALTSIRSFPAHHRWRRSSWSFIVECS
jgi:hypothetical protein